MKTEILRLERVSKSIEGFEALEDVNLNLYRGEILGVLGLNGSGKSMVVRLLSGDLVVDRGTIYVNEQARAIQSPSDVTRLGIHCVRQKSKLVPGFSIAENIFVIREKRPELAVIPFGEIYRQASALLASLGIDLAPDTIAGTLSSLDTHLVEIAKAIHHGATAIVMDDVTDDYSPRDFEKIQEFLHARCQEGVSFLFTTRRVEAAMALCDRITILRNGTTVRTLHRDEFSRQKLVDLLIGHSYEETFKKSAGHPGREVLRVEQLSNGSLLRGVNLCLHAGEVLSLLDIDGGLSSQLVQVLTGEQKVTAGAIYLGGRRTHLKNYRDAVRQGIGLVPEDWSTQFFTNLGLADNLAFLIYRKMSPGLMLVNPHLLKFAHQNFDEAFNPEGQPLNIANLKEVGHAERLKILMYRWMIRRPLALIINKPSLHIDLVVRQCLYRLIEALSQEGIGILLVATDLAEAAAISDRTIVIQNGAIHGEYSYQQVQEISLEDVA